jgi:DNA primase
VFVDWLRNAPHATTVAPRSLRPRPGAPVAGPLDWSELWSIAPDGIGLASAADRGDPWHGAPAIEAGPALEAVDGLIEEGGVVLEPFDRFRS